MSVGVRDTLDQVDLDGPSTESAAARVLSGRLGDSGPQPYSLCEARLSEAEYGWLTRWAWTVPPNAFRSTSLMQRQAAGLVLLALLAEWNRRNSDGDSVFVGAAELFGDLETRRSLFQDNGNPLARLRTVLREAAERYDLRHAFGPGEETTVRWYLTVQLQYGFCRAQILRVAGWLRGLPPTEAMQRLLAANGRQRSRSFQRLWSDLRHYRRGYVPTVEARRQLERNHWVLPEWVPDLLAQARATLAADGPAEEGGEDERPLVRPEALAWDPDLGPVVQFRPLAPAAGGDAIADRFDLYAGRRLVASWLLQPPAAPGADPEYRTAAGVIVLPAADPELVFRLEDEAGTVVATQTVTLWDPTAEVQVWRLGTAPPTGPVRWEAGRDVVVITCRGHTPARPAEAWFLTGYDTARERRWLRYTSAPPSLAVTDPAGRVVWEAVATPPPAWAAHVRIVPAAESRPPVLGGRLWFEVTASEGTRVEWVVANGHALTCDPATGRTDSIVLYPETAAAGHRLRVGLERHGVRVVRHEVVASPCRGLAHKPAADGGWRFRDPTNWVMAYESRRDLFRVFTEPDGPAVLMEGFEVHGRCDGRPRRLPQLLGTGAPLALVAGPYHVPAGERHRLAVGVQDTGIVVNGRQPAKWPGRLRLTLVRPVAPNDGHFVLLWSNRHGLHHVGPGGITAEDRGLTWSVETPWGDQPDAIVAAVGFDRERLGFWWAGKRHRFFAADENGDHPGVSARQHLALARWLRLPALWVNQRGRPNLERLAHSHPADLAAVALFDQGLAGLPSGIELHFDRTAAGRLAFDAIARQLLLEAPVTDAGAAAVSAVFDDEPTNDPRGLLVDRLFPAHPVLAARVARLTWGRPRADRARLRANVREHRLRLAGLPPGTPAAQFQQRLADLLAGACETFAENSRNPTDEYFVREGIVRPARAFVFDDRPLGDLDRHNLLVALGAGDFRTLLALYLLQDLEGRL